MHLLYVCHIGDITISGVTLNVDSDLNGASPQFTLTCISTGGPATDVTWTRDSGEVMGEESTMLVNAENADYTHTLTVTGRLPGLYTCTVENNKPSTVSQHFTVEGEMFDHSYRLILVPAASFSCSCLTSQWCDSSPDWSH